MGEFEGVPRLSSDQSPRMSGDHRRIAALSAKALELIAHHKLSPSPLNYELWFCYAANDNPALTAALDQAVTQGMASDPVAMRNLHERILGGATGEAIDEVGDQLSHEVSKLALALESAGADTRDYGRALKAAGDALRGDELGPRLKSILITVTVATQTMEARNKALEQQLQSSIAEVSNLRDRMEAVRRESLSDGLTGLANRRCFDERLRSAIAEAASAGTPLSLAIGDVDHFKRFNDTWGHAIGDQVLKLVAQCFRSNVKGRDTAARFGGEEFVVILPETALDDARKLAEQIRRSVETKKIVNRISGETLGSITLSLGVAQFRDSETAADLIERADQCLYGAKGAGRNRVLSERELTSRAEPSASKPGGGSMP
jgi:diguanylate cyclase